MQFHKISKAISSLKFQVTRKCHFKRKKTATEAMRLISGKNNPSLSRVFSFQMKLQRRLLKRLPLSNESVRWRFCKLSSPKCLIEMQIEEMWTCVRKRTCKTLAAFSVMEVNGLSNFRGFFNTPKSLVTGYRNIPFPSLLRRKKRGILLPPRVDAIHCD
jgi:hypothetical protein